MLQKAHLFVLFLLRFKNNGFILKKLQDYWSSDKMKFKLTFKAKEKEKILEGNSSEQALTEGNKLIMNERKGEK